MDGAILASTFSPRACDITGAFVPRFSYHCRISRLDALFFPSICKGRVHRDNGSLHHHVQLQADLQVGHVRMRDVQRIPYRGTHRRAKIMAMLENLDIAQSVVSITFDSILRIRFKWVACVAHKMKRSVQGYVSTDGLKQSLDKFKRAPAHLHKSVQSYKLSRPGRR